MAKFINAHGNLPQAEVEALANSVNTVGVMGKGIALQCQRWAVGLVGWTGTRFGHLLSTAWAA